MDKIKKILIVSPDKNLTEILNFCFDGWGYEVILREVIKPAETRAIKRLSPDVIVVDIQSARQEQLDICRQLKSNFSTAFIPIITLINKRQLRSQLLNLKQGVDDYLIKPLDPLDLRIRIEMAVRRAQHSIYASSLTGLPGGKILEDVLKEHLKKGTPFSFGYLDIDNFKYYNDVYGYRKGDSVILQTAHILFEALHSFGNSDDFISHIGGDDFVFLTTLDKYENICQHFIEAFDKLIPFHYSQDDRTQGFIIAKDRSRAIKRIPLMSISIAVVNREYTSTIRNALEINERVAEIKRYLKTISGSKFMADRRDSKLNKGGLPTVNPQAKQDTRYMPLGQILLGRKTINYEQLDEALSLHWRRGVILGEALKELGFIEEGELQNALQTQKTKLSYPEIKAQSSPHTDRIMLGPEQSN